MKKYIVGKAYKFAIKERYKKYDTEWVCDSGKVLDYKASLKIHLDHAKEYTCILVKIVHSYYQIYIPELNVTTVGYVGDFETCTLEPLPMNYNKYWAELNQ